MNCPKCGQAGRKHWRHCPQLKEIVCCQCCQSCQYYDPAPEAVWHCRHYILHPQPDYEGEHEKICRKIDSKRKQARNLYRKNKPKIAEKIEQEIKWHEHEKAELERRMYAEKDKETGDEK